VGDISLEAGGRSPLVRTAVGNAGDNGGQRDNVGGGAAEEDQRHRVGGSWLPGDGEGLAGGDNLVQRTSDGVARWLANRGVLSCGEAGEEGNDGDLGEHVDGCWVLCD